MPDTFQVCDKLFGRVGHSIIGEKKTRDYYFLRSTDSTEALIVRTWNGSQKYEAIMTTIDQSLVDQLTADSLDITKIVKVKKSSKEKLQSFTTIFALPLLNRITHMFRGAVR
jgi:hypothetical protein